MGDLPDIRATDADRERTVTVLRTSVANGQLTVDELDERVEAAYAAKTRGELERLVEDLGETRDRPDDVPVRPGDDGTHWVVSIMGGSDRKGRWRVGRTCTVFPLTVRARISSSDTPRSRSIVSALSRAKWEVPHGTALTTRPSGRGMGWSLSAIARRPPRMCSTSDSASFARCQARPCSVGVIAPRAASIC